MKRGLIFLFLVFFCFFGCSDYSKSSWKSPGMFTDLTSSTSPAPMLKFQWNRTARERNQLHSDLITENNGLLWARTYEIGRESYILSVHQTNDGGYIVGAMAWGLDEADLNNMVVLKLSSDGLVEWQKTYGGIGVDGWWQACVKQTNDGGYILAGDTSTPSGGADFNDVVFLKLSSRGNIEWQKTYGGVKAEYIRSKVHITSDEGYIVAGTFQDPIKETTAAWVLKLSSTGKVEWQKTYGEPTRYRFGDSICQTSDGGYVVGGGFADPNLSGKVDPWILKLNSVGEIEWQKVYLGHGRNTDFLCRVLQTKDGGYIVADLTVIPEDQENDVWILKLDPNGNIEWQKTYGGSKEERLGGHILQTSNGGYAVLCYARSFGDEKIDCWILKLKSNGNIEWQKTYGQNEYLEVGFTIFETEDNGYLVGGYKENDKPVMLIFKTDKNGNLFEGCDWVENSNARVRNTSAVPTNTNIIPAEPDIQVKTSHLPVENISVETEIICWNLNQPPINVSLSRETNRSLFRQEFFNIIRWEPNPYNSEFEITEYRIYREWGGEYDLIGTVQGNIFEYMNPDSITDESRRYEYAVTSVDSQGNESPKSETVEG